MGMFDCNIIFLLHIKQIIPCQRFKDKIRSHCYYFRLALIALNADYL